MGLNDNTLKTAQRLQVSNELKAEEIRQKRIEKQKNDDLKRIKSDIIEMLKNEFKKYIFDIGSGYNVEFLSIERKNEILRNILEQYKEEKTIYNKKIYIIKYKSEITQIFDDNYYKILKQITTEKQNDEKYKYLKYKEEQEKQEQQQPQEKSINYNKIANIIICILLFPVLAIIFLIIGIFKGMK